jgi:hypothetical protein
MTPVEMLNIGIIFFGFVLCSAFFLSALFIIVVKLVGLERTLSKDRGKVGRVGVNVSPGHLDPKNPPKNEG